METQLQTEQFHQKFLYTYDSLESLFIQKQKFSKTKSDYNSLLENLSAALNPIQLNDENISDEDTIDSFSDEINKQINHKRRYTFLKESKILLTQIPEFILN
jgi:hypothetical protein